MQNVHRLPPVATPPCPRGQVAGRSPCSPRPCRAPPAPAEPGDAAPVPLRDRKRPRQLCTARPDAPRSSTMAAALLLPPRSPPSVIKRAPRWKKGAHHHHPRATALLSPLPLLSSSAPQPWPPLPRKLAVESPTTPAIQKHTDATFKLASLFATLWPKKSTRDAVERPCRSSFPCLRPTDGRRASSTRSPPSGLPEPEQDVHTPGRAVLQLLVEQIERGLPMWRDRARSPHRRPPPCSHGIAAAHLPRAPPSAPSPPG